MRELPPGRHQRPELVDWLLLLAALILLCAALAGCATTEALLAAPEEWWATTWGVLAALAEDVWAVVGWVLPV